jgi:acyl-CoA dehydrogenase family protein 9
MTKKHFSPDLKASVAEGFFLGTIVEGNLFPYPEMKKEEAENVRMVIESIDRFMANKEELYRTFDREGNQPADYLDSLRELGLFGLIIPEEFDGLGLSNVAYSRVLQQTSRLDASTSLTIGAHSSIGIKGLLLFGTDQQKNKYLKKLASGEMIGAFCLTEPGSGSDAGSIKTNASKNSDGSWTLNGEKIWITNGATADFFTVFARTEGEKGKITAFIVERGFQGLSTGAKEDKMGIRASATTTVRFDNVKVPAENLLGEEGKGFKVAMNILNNGRTGLGGGSVGGMKRCIELASKQAVERKQFGKSISEFELVQEKIAQMTVQCFATESAVNMLGHYVDSGVENFSVEAAITKVFASESLWAVADEALQIAGGNGFMREYPYERIVRDSRINRIYEGTNEILRLYIALTGMKGAGEYLKEIGKSAGQIFNDPIKGFGVLSGYVQKRMTQLTSVGRQKLERVHPLLRSESEVFELYVLRLSKAVNEILRRLGKNIIGNQLISKRVADITIDLFVGFCVLSRVTKMLEEKGEAQCVDELRIARLFAQQAKRRMNSNLRRLEKNEDGDLKGLAQSIFGSGGYRWDVI